MELQFNNTTLKRKTPIKRNHKFFGRDDINLEMEFAMEYMEQDSQDQVLKVAV